MQSLSPSVVMGISVAIATLLSISAHATCPAGSKADKSGVCKPAVQCAPEQVELLGKCFDRCSDGTAPSNDGKCANSCPAGQAKDPKGVCKPAVQCAPEQVELLGKCFDRCSDGTAPSNDGKCPKACPAGKARASDGTCRQAPSRK